MTDDRRGGRMQAALLTYNLLLITGLPVLASCLAWRRVHQRHLRAGWQERLGRLPASVQALAGRRGLVWFHAVSVGEVVAAAPVVCEFQRLCPQAPILFSTVTETGRRTAEARLSHLEGLFYLPWDLPFIIRPVVQRLRPALLATVETERWPNLLEGARRAGARTALVNGRVSDRLFARLWSPWLRPWAPLLFGLYDRCLMQGRQDGERLCLLGVAPEQVVVTGNVKVDVALPQGDPQAAATLAAELGIEATAPVLVAGSTAAGEEEILLEAFQSIRQTLPGSRLVLAPRQVQRAAEIAGLVRRRRLPVVLRTELPARQGDSARARAVVVVDTIGELVRLYSLATVAFVGRSLVPMGGSNLLEALAYGRPVLIGPHMENFAEVARLALDHNLAFHVQDASQIVQQFLRWWADKQGAQALEHRAREVLATQRGAARRTAEELAALMEEGCRARPEC